MARSAETGDENFVILIDIVEATIPGDEAGDFLAGLDQLDSNALSGSGVGLFSFDTDLLNDNALGVRGVSEGVILPGRAQSDLLVGFISPFLILAAVMELASSANTVGNSYNQIIPSNPCSLTTHISLRVKKLQSFIPKNKTVFCPLQFIPK